ncbi:unnamed protein product, partial [Taenia asiatica]|uniref:Protein KRE1 n=1 Tax=Taenia asiatica TaxID=60517 RepID=A0A0R3VZ81_TAEAS
SQSTAQFSDADTLTTADTSEEAASVTTSSFVSTTGINYAAFTTPVTQDYWQDTAAYNGTDVRLTGAITDTTMPPSTAPTSSASLYPTDQTTLAPPTTSATQNYWHNTTVYNGTDVRLTSTTTDTTMPPSTAPTSNASLYPIDQTTLAPPTTSATQNYWHNTTVYNGTDVRLTGTTTDTTMQTSSAPKNNTSVNSTARTTASSSTRPAANKFWRTTAVPNRRDVRMTRATTNTTMQPSPAPKNNTFVNSTARTTLAPSKTPVTEKYLQTAAVFNKRDARTTIANSATSFAASVLTGSPTTTSSSNAFILASAASLFSFLFTFIS